MNKTHVALFVEQEGVLGTPILELEAANHCLPDLLMAVSNLGRFIPVRCVIADQVVTQMVIAAGGVTILGQAVRWEKR